MGNKKLPYTGFLKFTAVMYCILALVFTGGLSVATVGLIGLSWAGAVIEMLGIMSGVIALAIALMICFVSMIFMAVHTAVVLWNDKKSDASIFFLYQILWGFFDLISICMIIAVNLIMRINILITIAYFIFVIAIPILGIIAFSLKNMQTGEAEAEEGIKEDIMKHGIRAIKGDYAGASFTIKDNEMLTLGTNAGYCQILFQDKKISRRHCIISYNRSKNEYMLIDCSKNGTYLIDGTRIPAGVPYTCLPGMMFELNKKSQVFQFI